ncbi:hypothetical protein REJ26_003395 [Providencia stuartii]|uniref:hypothetical protein n=1 Tax=Providencia TaxID=586 RepID=UPI0027EBCA87|nr:hypothetical protein [Providencia sp. 2023EL-00965]ELR5301618.1 hypothetical protein [Providencia stuartii]MDW7590086.1 hypothetical protein [Providencia sp. 2023EL-00965]
MKLILRILLFLLGLIPIYSQAVYKAQTGVFNLVTSTATQVTGGSIVGDANGFSAVDANNIWKGIAPDGNTYNVSTLNYSYNGTITFSIDNSFYGDCYFDPNISRREAFIGWTVMKPGITGNVTKDDGALYSPNYPSGVGVQEKWIGIPDGEPDFVIEFNNPNVSAQVYVSNGPSGMYTMPGNGRRVYVHGAGQSPNVLPYSDIYGLSCGDVVRIGYPIPSEPIEPPEPDTVCDFWLNDDTLDLGTVDQKSAANANASARLNGICNADASVNLRATPYDMKMGGLTIRMMFDDYNSNTKSNWNLSEDRTESTSLWAVVTNIGNVIPGDYSKSGVVYIDYN